jgi:hypothetical protein
MQKKDGDTAGEDGDAGLQAGAGGSPKPRNANDT